MDSFEAVLARYGFKQSAEEIMTPYYMDQTVYENSGRTVTVSSVHQDEQWCDVEISGYGTFEPVKNLFAFVRGLGDHGDATRTNRQNGDLAKQHTRCANLLVEYCEDFLIGDLPAFRKRYRELFIVAAVRGARFDALSRKDWDDFDRFNLWLTDYPGQYDAFVHRRSEQTRHPDGHGLFDAVLNRDVVEE
jgi:hypothetical protein